MFGVGDVACRPISELPFPSHQGGIAGAHIDELGAVGGTMKAGMDKIGGGAVVDLYHMSYLTAAASCGGNCKTY